MACRWTAGLRHFSIVVYETNHWRGSLLWEKSRRDDSESSPWWATLFNGELANSSLREESSQRIRDQSLGDMCVMLRRVATSLRSSSSSFRTPVRGRNRVAFPFASSSSSSEPAGSRSPFFTESTVLSGQRAQGVPPFLDSP